MIGATNLDRRKAARVAAAVGTRLVPRPGHPNAASGAVAPETARGAEARRSRRRRRHRKPASPCSGRGGLAGACWVLKSGVPAVHRIHLSKPTENALL